MRVRSLVLVLVMLGLLIGPAGRAGAVIDCGHKGVFQRLPREVKGTWSRITRYDNNIDTACDFNFHVATQLMILTPSCQDWVEIGTRRYRTGGIFGGLKEKIFGEWSKFPAEPVVQFYADVDARPKLGFKVEQGPASGQWRIFYSLEPGSSGTPPWTLAASPTGWLVSTGQAEVEAERGGPSSENWMHQYHLNHKDGLVTGGWAAWDAVSCRRDDDLSYEPELPLTFPDDLNVYEGAGYCVYTGGN